MSSVPADGLGRATRPPVDGEMCALALECERASERASDYGAVCDSAATGVISGALPTRLAARRLVGRRR